LNKVINSTMHNTHWTNEQFHPIMHAGGSAHGCQGDLPCPGYPGMAAYSIDRDRYLYPLDVPTTTTTTTTATATATAGYRAFVARVNRTLAALKAVPSLAEMLQEEMLKEEHVQEEQQTTAGAGASDSLSAPRRALVEVDLTKSTPLVLENDKLRLTFNATNGAIASLVEKQTGIEWAQGVGLGQFVYRTYTQASDYDRYQQQYVPSSKPGKGPSRCSTVLLTICSHYMLTIHSLYTHCTLTVHSLYTHCTLTVYSLYTRCILTVYSVYTHYTLIIHSLCTHCTLTVHSLYTHCKHIIHTQSLDEDWDG
jgi:hypothetical protein